MTHFIEKSPLQQRIKIVNVKIQINSYNGVISSLVKILQI